MPRRALLIVALLTSASLSSFASPAGPAPPLRPFADYEAVGSVVMAAWDAYGAGDLKRAIARHLPSDVTLVLYGYSTDPRTRRNVLDDYGQFVSANRLVYIAFPKARNMFWSRDAMPVALRDSRGAVVFADGRYWGGFEPDREMAGLFGATLQSHEFRFEGGNFIANHLGDCFTVDSADTRTMTDALFADRYGCRAVTRLPKRGGIGHIDERARFTSATTVLTDTVEYASAFSRAGLTVVRLPRPANDRQTYVNSLLVNGVAFVPQFQRAEDAEALQAYRDLGFQTIGLDARSLAAKGSGLIHCLTMTYPGTPMAERARW